MSVKEMESDATPPEVLFVLKTSFFAKKIQKQSQVQICVYIHLPAMLVRLCCLYLQEI